MMHPVPPPDVVCPVRGGLNPHRLANVVGIEFCGAESVSVVRVSGGTATVLPSPMTKKDDGAWQGLTSELRRGLNLIPDENIVVLAGECFEHLVDRPQPGVEAFTRVGISIDQRTPGLVSTEDKVYYDGWISANAPVRRKPCRTIKWVRIGYRLATWAPWRDLEEIKRTNMMKAVESSARAVDAQRWAPGGVYSLDFELSLAALKDRFEGLGGTRFVTSFSE